MNTASLELSKTLYELSGWDETEDNWYQNYDDATITWAGVVDGANGVFICPAYDLGYLLRKLPSEISIEKKYNHADGVVYYAEATTGFESATTPEDAACLLALELFKQDVLIT